MLVCLECMILISIFQYQRENCFFNQYWFINRISASKAKMKKTKKVIQNYQIIQTLQQYENEYQILLARHTIEKKNYVLKKLSIKQGNNQALYEGLLNEAKLLKILNHENIVKCYRMLKTSNNIYLAYTYLQGSTLEELLQNGPKVLTFSQKQQIAKQLCLILSQMQKNDIAHLNINPENIIISQDNTIMLRQFIYAMEIPEQGEIEVDRKVPKSPYLAPQVRRGIACVQADLYSVGKLLQKLDFQKCKKDPTSSIDHSKRCQQLMEIIESLTIKDRTERITLNQLYQRMFPSKKKVKRLRSLSESGMSHSHISRANSISSTKSQFGGKQIYAQILMKILKHRNMSWILVRFFKRVTVDIHIPHDITVILGILFLKKSTKLLANLGKYLHYGKNDIMLEVNYKDQAKFFKTTDHRKICQIVDNEIAIQKKQFENSIQAIYINNSALLKKPQFSKQLKEEQNDKKYFDICIRQYIVMILDNTQKVNNLSDQIIFDLYLMSFIVYFKGIEEFFKQRILFDPINLDEQIFIKNGKQMNRVKLIQKIKENLQSKISQI